MEPLTQHRHSEGKDTISNLSSTPLLCHFFSYNHSNLESFLLVIKRENVWIPLKSLLFSTFTKQPYKLFSLIFLLLYFSFSHFSAQQNRPLVLVLLLAMSMENLWGNVFIGSNCIRCKVSGSTSSSRLLNFYKALIASLDGEGGKGSRGELVKNQNVSQFPNQHKKKKSQITR